MRKLLYTALILVAVGCAESGPETVSIANHKDQIDDNTARIELLEAQDKLQDLRLDDLEGRVGSLEGRMTEAENAIDSGEEQILELFDAVDLLGSDLESLRDELATEVAKLSRADRKTRRMIRRKVRRLRRALSSEIRSRRMADSRLQSQIEDVEEDLRSFEARQAVINRFLSRGLFMTNLRISQLQRQISYALYALDRRLGSVESDIQSINSEISSMQGQMTQMQSEIDSLDERMSDSEELLAELIDEVGELDDDLSELRGELRASIRDLRRADRQNKRHVLRKVSKTRKKLTREIRKRKRADSRLQAQIDDVESKLVSVVYPCGEENGEEVLLKTQDGLVAYFQQMGTQRIRFSDTATIDAYTIPAHHDLYCADTSFVSGRCNDYRTRLVGEHTIPAQTLRVGDSASVSVLRRAYLDVLADGNYRTTDGYSCNFSIVNGEVAND